MENLVQAKTKMVNSPVQETEYFVAENNIVPLKIVSPQLILELEETKDEHILEENEVKKVVKENKGKHILDKFFIKVSDYVDNVENFLRKLIQLQLKSIQQKKLIYEIERIDQFFKTRRSKKLIENKRKADKKSKSKEVNLATDQDTAILIATSLGLGGERALSSILSGGTQVYGDVAREGEFGVERGGTNVTEPPAWIPFPKGTPGLVYTSGYGMRWGRPHSGIDIAGPVGSPIITPISGIVTASGDDGGGGYGYRVIIKSGQIEMLFGHLHQQPPVAVGQQVQAGTRIGGLGSTGRSTGPHLHWNVYVNGRTVDPVQWTKANPPQVGTSNFRQSDNPSRQKPLDQESEGGININKRIMVGEAGTEFMIPISQMPLFIKAMMEEKVKTLIPNYEGSAGFKSNLKTSSGSAKTMFASGGIAGGSPEFWQMVAISATEDIRHPQGQADVAQSIYNRVAVGSYPGGRNITKIIVADGQYQPTFKNPGDWSAIKDRKSAINAAKILPYVGKKAPQLIDSAAKAITNPALQKEAARFIGGRTDFMGESQKDSMKPEDITRGKNHNYFGWFYDARLPKAAPVHPSVKSMTKAANAPSKSKPKPKDKNIFEKIKNLFFPSEDKKIVNIFEDSVEEEQIAFSPTPTTTPGLTDIPDNIQQEIAYDTQSKFEMFAEQENSIVIVKVPVIIDKTTTGIKVVG